MPRIQNALKLTNMNLKTKKKSGVCQQKHSKIQNSTMTKTHFIRFVSSRWLIPSDFSTEKYNAGGCTQNEACGRCQAHGSNLKYVVALLYFTTSDHHHSSSNRFTAAVRITAKSSTSFHQSVDYQCIGD